MHSQPCFVPPHPDLLAQRKAESSKLQGAAQESLRTTNRLFDIPSGRRPGLNDGTIFPESHYEKAPTLSKMSRAALDRAPLRGAIRVAVVLVEFTDTKFPAGAKERFEELFFSTGKVPTGSVTEFYDEVSNGLVSLTGEVVGPFQLNNTLAYYANGNSGTSGSYPNSRTMADEALSAADGSINLGPYDNDDNGYVDGFIVVHAGRGAEQTGSANDIWSVKWVLPSERAVDGVKVFAFLTIPEDGKLGVAAHELGHLLFGWPDLYDTDYSSSGVGYWCLMSFGSWGGGGDRPVHPSAWCKANQGWVDVINETENRQVTIADVKSERKVHRLWKNGDSGNEYFLVENREPTAFDGQIPAGGLLVWHVDDAVDSNTNEAHPKVGLVQADGLDQLQSKASSGDAGDPFPGTSNTVAFTSTSNPNSRAYSGDDTYVSITSIPSASPSMTIDVTVKPQSGVGPFNSKVWYRLKNTLEGYALDINNDGSDHVEGRLILAREGNYSGQYWQIKAREDGSYQIRNLFLGPNRALDVYGNDKNTPYVADIGYVSGQFWSITPWGDGSYHLENEYSGMYLSLDSIEGGTGVSMNSGPNAGRPTQRWTFTETGPINEAEFLA